MGKILDVTSTSWLKKGFLPDIQFGGGLANDEGADEHGDAGEEEGDDGGPPGGDSHVISAEGGYRKNLVSELA